MIEKFEGPRVRDGGRGTGGGGLLLALALVFGAAPAGEVKFAGKTEPLEISVVRRVNVSYYPVAKGTPLEFEAAGPGWLRIYTRLWWPLGADGPRKYGLSLWHDEVERPVSFETRPSRSSLGPGGRRVGEWRSFFVQTPEGSNRYRLEVLGGAETVGVRIVLQAPRPSRTVAIPGARELTLADGRDTAHLYEILAGKPLALELEGPCHARVRARLNFVPALAGAQNFVLTVQEGKTTLVRRNLRAARSPSALYADEPGLVPSSERVLKFALPGGRHSLTLLLNGTLAKTGAIGVEVLASEKYE